MARLWQSGFELQSLTAGIEFTAVGTSGAAIDTVAGEPRSGNACLKISGMVSGTACGALFQFASAGAFFVYHRCYLKVATLPASNTIFMGTSSTAAFSGSGLAAFLNNAGNVGLVTSNTIRGTSTVTVNDGNWHRIELVSTSSTSAELRIDGVTAATSVVGLGSGISLAVGGNLGSEAQSTGVWYIDDVAVNDSSGTIQTSWPGAGSIIHVKPNGAGDNNGFATQVGGTAGSANNYTRVNETTPNDVTSYNASATLGTIDDFAVEAPPAIDSVNCVMVGVRYGAASATADASFQVRCKKTSGGTVASGTTITPAATTWLTNAAAAPKKYPLILYNDPDGAAWTTSTLNSMQIGYTISTGNTNAARISTVWASVDYNPSLDPFPAAYGGGLRQTQNNAIYRMRQEDPERYDWLMKQPYRRNRAGLHIPEYLLEH